MSKKMPPDFRKLHLEALYTYLNETTGACVILVNTDAGPEVKEIGQGNPSVFFNIGGFAVKYLHFHEEYVHFECRCQGKVYELFIKYEDILGVRYNRDLIYLGGVCRIVGQDEDGRLMLAPGEIAPPEQDDKKESSVPKPQNGHTSPFKVIEGGKD
ncbi:putative bacterial stringent starvation protein [Pseudomonas phage EL]|uniref:Putative bacterial stringent starvation protein n=1 Tax=Pseudomonas phage EL TaxID=273133 RepID=Q2Z0Z5_9CAUD|nr:putative bacterial stringent starvation protein [Pseudomonas phage EL]CAG27180.1 putative bacterial stringent starvation protein [Pseudomonas phage EL]